MKIKLFIVALILFGGSAVLALAQDKAAGQSQEVPVPAGRGVYVDADNNGICDYFEMRGANYGFGRGQGYGRAQAAVQGYGRGQAAAQGYGRAQMAVPGGG
ncbi:MAG TPA: hypothetical protein PLZ75_01685, partial [Bacteroidales bacterium]|nr:hypothetical protein [Bacteroidales bacterium]